MPSAASTGALSTATWRSGRPASCVHPPDRPRCEAATSRNPQERAWGCLRFGLPLVDGMFRDGCLSYRAARAAPPGIFSHALSASATATATATAPSPGARARRQALARVAHARSAMRLGCAPRSGRGDRLRAAPPPAQRPQRPPPHRARAVAQCSNSRGRAFFLLASRFHKSKKKI